MSQQRAGIRRHIGTTGRLLAPALLGLAGCTTSVPVTDAVARATAQQAFETVLADSGWRADRFAPGTMTRTDIGWTVAYTCKLDASGALVILIARDGSAGYSLAPPAACRAQGKA